MTSIEIPWALTPLTDYSTGASPDEDWRIEAMRRFSDESLTYREMLNAALDALRDAHRENARLIGIMRTQRQTIRDYFSGEAGRK